MAGQTNGSNQVKDKRNPIIGFLFAIIIPIIIAAILIIVILEIAGVDVMDWTKEKVGIISVTETDSTEKEGKTADNIQSAIEEKDTEIEILNQDIRILEATIDELEQEIVKFENNQEGVSSTASEGDTVQQTDDSIAVVANAYKEMDGEQSAAILESLDRETAVNILLAVSNKVRGSILQEMDTQIAAELTQLLLETEN
ncbi:hypothetical protein CUC15_09180 [Oceanobacillus zhaokaii]|uniref:Magnesium transporter MgtE intracellular domain-containing protein n=1 Tax=Oceanobacillus zhaokaii TaxID=2052660 RepID=A0A345PGF5_9BACI|nr:hypothetical protein [Oceanobacillus zhaokaii]AXI09085.1 hypothetical protein CUC15_09180 [Oceanobacillus zhaokaii]